MPDLRRGGNRPGRLGREQVWLTEKDDDGATELYPMTAAGPRPDANLERGYLQGRYGGIPRVTPGRLAWRVGLAKTAEQAAPAR